MYLAKTASLLQTRLSTRSSESSRPLQLVCRLVPLALSCTTSTNSARFFPSSFQEQIALCLTHFPLTQTWLLRCIPFSSWKTSTRYYRSLNGCEFGTLPPLRSTEDVLAVRWSSHAFASDGEATEDEDAREVGVVLFLGLRDSVALLNAHETPEHASYRRHAQAEAQDPCS